MGVKTAGPFFVIALMVGFFVIMNLFIAILLEAFADDEEEEEEEGENGEEGEKEKEEPEQPKLDLAKMAGLAEEEEKVLEPLEGVSLCCMGPENSFRKFCQWLVCHQVFDTFTVVLIVVSSICLALDVPRLDKTSELKHYLVVSNYYFTGFFVFEMSLKIIAYDFIGAPKAYLKEGWNVLDFAIVLISILGLLASIVPVFGQLKSLRILRVLRPLRLLQRNPGMKLIITSLVATLTPVGEVSAVVLVFHVVFSIIGMMMFGGQFGSCTDASITVRAECYPSPAESTRILLEAHQWPTSSVETARRRLLELDTRGPASTLPSRVTSSWAELPTLPSLAPSSYPIDNQTAIGEVVRPVTADELVSEHALGARPLDHEAFAARRLAVEASATPEERAAWKHAKMRRGRALYSKRRELGRWQRGRGLKGGGDGVESQDSDLPTQWLNPAFGSFDDFGSSMLILYVASTGDGWEEFMWAGMDVQGVDVAPRRNDHSFNSFFFIIWMIVGSFVALNLFVGAIVDNFTRIKSESDGSATMTPEQQQWVNAMKGGANTKPAKAARPPKGGLRYSAFQLINSSTFEYSVMAVIGLNVIGMALDYHHMKNDKAYYMFYHTGMLFFTYFYYCECVLKLFAMGGHYFQDSWCRFDFFLVCMSILDQFFLELLMKYLPVPPTVLRVMRVARVLRVLRLLKNLKGLRDLVMTLVFAFPALINVGALLGIVIFMYAVLGMNLFTYVAHGDDLNDDRNFESFWSACLLLFQCLTGDGWSAMMSDAMINEERGCDPMPDDGSPSDCGSILALPYFISYTVIGAFVFLNLVVAVILENFTALGNIDPSLVSSSDIADFKEEWAVFDPDADGYIRTKDLPQLLMSLPAPLGLKGSALVEGSNPRPKALKFCLGLGLTQKDGHVQFKQVLDALIKKNYAAKEVAVAAPPEPETVEGESSSKKPSSNVLTPRRREMAAIYAEELISGFIKARKESPGGFSPSPKRRQPSPLQRKPFDTGFGQPSNGACETSPAPAPTPLNASPALTTKPKSAAHVGEGSASGPKRKGPSASSGGHASGARGAGTPPSRQEQGMSRSTPTRAQGQKPGSQRPQRPPGSVARTPGHGSSTDLPRPSRMPPPGVAR